MSFASRWVQAPAHVTERPGGLAAGFRAGGAACGIKPSGEPDLGLLVSDEPDAVSAARFTRSGVVAPPVALCRERCRLDALRAVVVELGQRQRRDRPPRLRGRRPHAGRRRHGRRRARGPRGHAPPA